VKDETIKVKDETIKHPSFGMIHYSRRHGSGQRVFGSPFDHHSLIAISICQADLRHDLGEDRYFGHSSPLIEVELSPAQFAEFLTNGNTCGVPCSINATQGKGIIPRYEGNTTESDRTHDDLVKSIESISDQITFDEKRLEGILSKPSIGKGDREEIKKIISSVQTQIRNSLPFYAKQLQESATRVVTEAKAEINAYVHDAVQNAGLKAIHERGDAAVALLESKFGDEGKPGL